MEDKTFLLDKEVITVLESQCDPRVLLQLYTHLYTTYYAGELFKTIKMKHSQILAECKFDPSCLKTLSTPIKLHIPPPKCPPSPSTTESDIELLDVEKEMAIPKKKKEPLPKKAKKSSRTSVLSQIALAVADILKITDYSSDTTSSSNESLPDLYQPLDLRTPFALLETKPKKV